MAFGIMKTQQILNTEIYQERCCFTTNSNSYGLDQIIKGKYLNEVRGDIDCLEIRVNISKGIVLFMDYPKYQHVNKVNEQKILQNIDYSFGILFVTPGGDDYYIDIESKLHDDTYNLLNFEVN